MIYRLLVLLIFICSISLLSAQGRISGEVSDSLNQTHLDAAQVILLKKGTTNVIQSSFADSLGKFSFDQIAIGSYQLETKLLGYFPKSLSVELTSQKLEVSSLKILLAPQAKVLQEAEILSEKPVIRNVAGKIIFDVAKTVSDGAETAQESLQKIPGVNVSESGSVTVRGKSNVKILVDGKSNPMAETNPEQFLKSIPAKNIETIEVNTAPSAKYDASGSGVVINIKLKKGKLEGFNGSLTAGVGTVFNKYNGSGNFNYKKGKINVFGNGYYSNEIKWSRSSDDSKISSDSPTYFNRNLNGQTHSQNGSGKLGIEYAMDKYHALTYSIDGGYWDWAQKSWGNGDTRNAFNQLVYTDIQNRTANNADISFTNSINYRQTFDTTDRAWTIDIAHTYDKRNNNGQSYSHTYDTLGVEVPSTFFSKNTISQGVTHNILLQSDFNTPLKWMDSKIETGVKEEINIFDNSNDVFDGSTGVDIKDTVQSNRFKYLESVTAAYGTYTGKYKSFTYSGGLRWEHTYINSPLNAVRQSYSSFFPSVTLGYNITESHILTLSYGRNIERPGFWMLNNSITYTTPHSLWLGNPDIKPAFVNSVNLEYNATLGKQTLTFSGSFAHIGGTFQQINNVDSNNITSSRYENAGTEMSMFFSVDGSFKITKWWDFSMSPGYGHHWYSYVYNNTLLKSGGDEFSLWGSTTFRFWKNASLQLWGWGNSGFLGAQSKTQPVGNLTVTLRKKFFKDHLTIAISCRDVLNTMTWTTHTFNPVLDERNVWKSESRVGYLTLTYQFGKQSFSPDQKTKGKSSRIGGGGGNGGGN
ncbi:MAG: TonB-dependent receptor [Bacteroidota bacterium]|nr:TonB-dependent receptor [Bacteroidota bacterium]